MAFRGHPKELLYTNAYDPLVAVWFEELMSDPRLIQIIEAARGNDVATSLRHLNALFAEVASDVVRRSGREIETVARHRDMVLWEGHRVPDADAGLHEVASSLDHKFERNIGQALIEALLCLESARTFLTQAGHSGARLYAVLGNSTSLITSLAVLHNNRQIPYLTMLVGGRAFDFPQVTPEHVVGGEFHIAARHLRLSGHGRTERVKFRPRAPQLEVLESPTMICPAHRLNDSTGERINHRFWRLLVEIYSKSAPAAPGQGHPGTGT
ncbi:MAG TPA: hypothetical protein VIP77_12615 [Jiangellaceae bacterium]